MKQNSIEEAEDAIRQIRRLMADWLRTSKDSREPVAAMLDLLDTVDGYVRASQHKSKSGPATGGRPSESTYTIDKRKNEQEVLTEHRAGGTSQPFRCPRYIYDDTVKALAQLEPALEFDALMKALSKSGEDPAEFQVRSALRFLLAVTPPLLSRDRNRYRPVRPTKFEAEAKAAWAALAKQSK